MSGNPQPDNRTVLKVAHINICSLRNKVHEIHHILHANKIHIIINETWLDSSVSDSLLNIPGYRIYQNDRNLRGGGVCLYVMSSLHARLIMPASNTHLESLFVSVHIAREPDACKLLVSSVYRPPSSGTEFWEQYSAQLDGIFVDSSDLPEAQWVGQRP